MATVDQIKPILDTQFIAAINWAIGETNRTGGMYRLVDLTGISYGTIQAYAYGTSTPTYAHFVCLCDNMPGFEERVRGGISPSMNERESKAEEKLAAVSGKVEELQAIIGGPVIPMRGRVS